MEIPFLRYRNAEAWPFSLSKQEPRRRRCCNDRGSERLRMFREENRDDDTIAVERLSRFRGGLVANGSLFTDFSLTKLDHPLTGCYLRPASDHPRLRREPIEDHSNSFETLQVAVLRHFERWRTSSVGYERPLEPCTK